jgi:hypothetical protein
MYECIIHSASTGAWGLSQPGRLIYLRARAGPESVGQMFAPVVWLGRSLQRLGARSRSLGANSPACDKSATTRRHRVVEDSDPATLRRIRTLGRSIRCAPNSSHQPSFRIKPHVVALGPATRSFRFCRSRPIPAMKAGIDIHVIISLRFNVVKSDSNRRTTTRSLRLNEIWGSSRLSKHR